MNAQTRPLYLTPAQARLAKDEAQAIYEATPHTNLRVGRERYRAAIEAINELEGRDRD